MRQVRAKLLSCLGDVIRESRWSHRAGQPPPPQRPGEWVVEIGQSWFNRFRRLLIRWDKQAKHYLAFAQVAACLIIYRKVRHARLHSG
jgi:hypothetical protein